MKSTYRFSAVLGAGLLLFSSVAQAEVIVVVGAKSPVSTLTKGQVSDLYLGKAKDFPSGGAALTTMIAAGGLKDEFLDKVLSKTDAQARSVWARLTFTGSGSAPKELANSEEVKKLANSNPNVIGFIDKSAVDGQVKVIYAP